MTSDETYALISVISIVYAFLVGIIANHYWPNPTDKQICFTFIMGGPIMWVALFIITLFALRKRFFKWLAEEDKPE